MKNRNRLAIGLTLLLMAPIALAAPSLGELISGNLVNYLNQATSKQTSVGSRNAEYQNATVETVANPLVQNVYLADLEQDIRQTFQTPLLFQPDYVKRNGKLGA
ncbi:hypothetical protein IPJ72_01125 [Candidatus Peregrinibacteria bacterium]|nr:MAG: hypothetical protein IPJ72_01125 [Candidatus Peregrinibacteria bacterium]